MFVDQLKTVVDRKILTDVVDNKIDSSLENPRACEKSGPCLNSIVKNFGLRWHKESRVPTNLAKFGVSHLSFDD